MNAPELLTPPHSIEAEQSVLGGIFLDKDAFDTIDGSIHETDFYRHDHQIIFSAISHLKAKNQPTDAVTTAEYLDSKGLLQEAGDLSYLAQLAENTPSAANAKAYAAIVRKNAVLRSMIQLSGQMRDGCTAKEDPEEIIQRITQELASLSHDKDKGLTHIREIVPGTLDELGARFESGGKMSGLSTGFSDLDDRLGGFGKQDLIVLAGRPSMGKTALSLNIAEHVALTEKKNVAVFSMEMSDKSLVERTLAGMSRVNSHHMRNGRIGQEDIARVVSHSSALTAANIWIDETPAIPAPLLRARARRLNSQHQLDLVVIDYLQLMVLPSGNQNKADLIGQITGQMKAMAKEINAPVVLLSQLNRSLENRPNKRPTMSDLRDSGSIEADADVILFVYRDEVYNEESADKGIAEIIIGKQRSGPIGTVRLVFRGEYVKFENYTDERQ